VSRPAAFLDRDGTLMVDSGFIGDPNRIEMLPGVAEALALLEAAGYARIVVTNQSGVARGMFGAPDVENVHRALAQRLAAEGASLDAFYYCAHLGAGCDCRKPAPGMIRRAAAEHDLDLARSVVFGDRGSDVALGTQLGIDAVLVNARLPYDGPPPLLEAPTFLAGVRTYLELVRA